MSEREVEEIIFEDKKLNLSAMRLFKELTKESRALARKEKLTPSKVKKVIKQIRNK